MYTVPGRNPTIELLRSNVNCKEILIEKNIGKDQKVTELINLAKTKNVRIKEVSNKELSKLLDQSTPHQGVISFAESFSPKLDLKEIQDSKLENQFYIYIRESQYDHNFAAIIRSAECLGVQGVIISPGSKITPNACRIAMGANFHIPIAQNSLFNTIKLFKKSGYKTVAIEISGDKYLYESNLTLPTMLIVGGEDRSISKEISQQIDELLLIPQSGMVNSLNMSVAASLAIYERLRQLNN